MFVDSHCHLDDPRFSDDLDAVVERARIAGVTRMLSIGTGEGLPDLQAGIRMAERYPEVYATAGIHPQFAPNAEEPHLRQLRELLSHPKVLGVGEIGLDYYWKPFDSDAQARLFVSQLEIAREARKPVTIHTREAWPDTFALLREHWAPSGLPCILHCFTGGLEEAQQAIKMGFYLSFAGIVTYPKAVHVHEAAKAVPADRLLIETDAPYLAPVPHRGARNEPAFVQHTARQVARLRGTTADEIARVSALNFNHLFGLPA